MKLKSIVLLALLFLAVVSCKKDDNNNGGGDNPSGTNYRMTESISTGEGSIKDVYSYDSDKLSLVMEYTQSTKGDWAEDNKTEYSYTDNSFEMLTSDYYDGEWELGEKEVITHNNGQWQSDIVYEYNGADWMTDSKVQYTYTNNKLTLEEGFWYDDGAEQKDYKYIYSYVGDTPSTVMRYTWVEGNWLDAGKDTLTFSNGKLANIIYDMSIEGMTYKMKSEFQYAGDVITSIAMSMYMNDVWTSIGTITFTYDSNGNMIKEEATGQYFNSSTTYTYEEGNSNWALIGGDPESNFYGAGYILPVMAKSNSEINKIVDILKSSK